MFVTKLYTSRVTAEITWWLGHIIKKIGLSTGSSGFEKDASTKNLALSVSASGLEGNCVLGCPERIFIRVKFDDAPSHRRMDTLRAVCCKDQLRSCKIEKTDFPKLCQNIGLGELFLKI